MLFAFFIDLMQCLHQHYVSRYITVVKKLWSSVIRTGIPERTYGERTEAMMSDYMFNTCSAALEPTQKETRKCRFLFYFTKKYADGIINRIHHCANRGQS